MKHIIPLYTSLLMSLAYASIASAGPDKLPSSSNGDVSGYCCMSYDVSKKGKPRNIDAYFCSHSMFKDIAQQSVKKWRHNPKIVDGKKVEQSQLLTKMAFYLEDEDGNLMYDPELFIPKGVDKRYPDGWSKTECRKSETETSDTAEETP